MNEYTMHIKTLIRSFFVLTLIIFASITALTVSGNRFFTVELIEIRGNDKISDREVVKRSGIRAGYTSMFFLENRAEELIRKNPWVSSVSVSKEFPGRVVVEIDEFEPFCITLDETDTPYYMNSEGERIGKAEIKHGLDFPIIRTEGKVKKNIIEEAIRILKLSKTSTILKWEEISEVKVNQDFGIRIFTTDKRLIDFGRGNILGKWYKVEKIISHSRSVNLQEQYINVSSENIGVINFSI